MDKLFSDLQSFDSRKLKQVDSQITSVEGKKYTEQRNRCTGEVTTKLTDEVAFGFCPDYAPDKTVGVSATGILVGSQDVAQDLAELKKLGVTHILNVAGKYIPNAFPDEFTYMSVEMFDDLDESISVHYPKCERFIDEGRTHGAVLVHCNAGRSRSSSVAIAYVMHREHIGLSQALERLRETRPSVEPNEAFMKQLRQMEKELGIN